MSEPFVGEIRMFAGNFAPRGWALCDGQVLAVSQNTALFSLVGAVYGGDERSTFRLPDMRGRIPVHAGSGPGLSSRTLGATLGTERSTVTVDQTPPHTHTLQANTQHGAAGRPAGATPAQSTAAVYRQSSDPASVVQLRTQSIGPVGGSQSHDSLMPFLCVNFIIALNGIYPSRS
jgi:microcystin-dependent protein